MQPYIKKLSLSSYFFQNNTPTMNTFSYQESDSIDYQMILNVLKGEVSCCIFRGIISPHVCQKIVKNFWENPLVSKRKDDVPAYNLGAYHFNKSLEEYFDEVQKTKLHLQQLFAGVDNIHEKFVGNFKNFLNKENICFRKAQHSQREAGDFLVRACRQKDADYIIKPHEDMAQCSNHKQRGFEVQGVQKHHIVAGNVCLQNDCRGDLYCWHIKSNDTLRKELGIIGKGYPYPYKVLENVPCIKIPIFPGDFYFLNGENIHAVKADTPSSNTFRSTLSFFMGFINEKTVVSWT